MTIEDNAVDEGWSVGRSFVCNLRKTVLLGAVEANFIQASMKPTFRQ
jgi:hypothetical protein